MRNLHGYINFPKGTINEKHQWRFVWLMEAVAVVTLKIRWSVYCTLRELAARLSMCECLVNKLIRFIFFIRLGEVRQ